MEELLIKDNSGAFIKGHFDLETCPEHPHFYLHKINVPESERGKGLGTRLIRELLITCLSRDIHEIYGWMCSENMEAAQRFYERNGFELETNEFGHVELFLDIDSVAAKT